ncbi:MAG: substrate-binding domain-containing protein [Nitrososphaerota archaeon]|nr:substrate-binding domain-containing protein [Nitrososphaerota archaeon]MDG6939810.1 substrate-binding domain-containing protein [Nitrososphaerota archaeon]
MKRGRAATVLLLVLVSVASAWAGYAGGSMAPPAGGKPLVLVASLYAPLLQAASSQSGVQVALQAEGSVAAARQLTLAPGRYSMFLSVDPYVITSLLFPKYATWYVAVALDSMVIAYSASAPHAAELKLLGQQISSDDAAGDYGGALNATRAALGIVFSSNGTIGTSNPNTDPEGYRALMVLQLAGMLFHGSASHYTALLQDANLTGRVTEVDAGSQLFGYVQSGQVDYDLAVYESAARSAGLSYIPLPPQLSLGDPAFYSYYSQASVSIGAGGSAFVVRGAPILVSITIPAGAPDQGAASQLLLYLVSPQGRSLMDGMGIRPLAPAVLYGNESGLPPPLSYVLNSTLLRYGGEP